MAPESLLEWTWSEKSLICATLKENIKIMQCLCACRKIANRKGLEDCPKVQTFDYIFSLR